MFNEQMLENLNRIPSVKDLWQNEKSKYRVWVLLFGIGVFIIFTLLLSSFILDLVNENQIEQNLINNANNKIDVLSQARYLFTTRYIVIPILQISILLFGLVYYLTSIYASYKQRSFSKISLSSTTIVSIGALFSLWNVISFFIPVGESASQISQTPGELFRFINYFITIFVWLLTVGQVIRIRNNFLISERAEKLKQDPRYQAFLNGNFQQQNQSFGGFPFGFGPSSQTPKNKTNNTKTTSSNPGKASSSKVTQNEEVKAKLSKMSENESKLTKMTLRQLKEVAQKLSISGYEKMTKNVLIKTILRITS